MTPIELVRKITEQYFEAREDAIRDALAAFALTTGDQSTPEELARSGRAILVRVVGRPWVEKLWIDGRNMVTFQIGDANGDTQIKQKRNDDHSETVSFGSAWSIKKHY